MGLLKMKGKKSVYQVWAWRPVVYLSWLLCATHMFVYTGFLFLSETWYACVHMDNNDTQNTQLREIVQQKGNFQKKNSVDCMVKPNFSFNLVQNIWKRKQNINPPFRTSTIPKKPHKYMTKRSFHQLTAPSLNNIWDSGFCEEVTRSQYL